MRIFTITIIALLLSWSLSAQTESEPNDSFAQANILTLANQKASIKGSINPKKDKDFYKVTVPKSGVLISSVTNVPANIHMEIVMYDSGQNRIGIYGAGTKGTPVSITKLVCEPGVYYYKLHDRYDSSLSTELYSFKVSFDTLDVYECNNSFSKASQIELDHGISAQIFGKKDVDFFKVEIPRSGVLAANVTNVPANIHMEIVMYDSGQNRIGIYGAGTKGTPVSITKLVCEPGVYYYKLHDRYESSLSAELYSFKVNFDTLDVYECNNSFSKATSINICDTIHATIYDHDDVDFFVFYGIKDEIINFSLTNISKNIKRNLEIYDKAGTKIKSKTGNSDNPIDFSFTPPSSDQYFIKIGDSGNYNSNTLYQLILENSNCITATNRIEFNHNIQLFPNPVTDVINIDNQNSTQFTQIYLINARGELIRKINTNVSSIDISNEYSGLYFLVFMDEYGNSLTKKVVKI